MDELTFLLILAGIGIVLLVAMFTYYRHHKKIHDEIQDFNRHHDLDDILLDEKKQPVPHQDRLSHEELPSSFSTTQHDNFDIDSVFHKSQATRAENITSDSTDPAGIKSTVSSASVATKNETAVVKSDHPPATDSMSETGRQSLDAEIRISESGKTGLETEAQIPTQAQTSVNTPLADAARPVPKPEQIRFGKSEKQAQFIEVICEPLPKGVSDLILSFTIVSRGEKFTGTNLKKAFEDSGLRFGEMNIYHYPGDKNHTSYALFSAANLVEPGTFNMAELNQFSTPGISLFMRLPTRKSAFDAFDEFLRVSRLLSQKLGGELCDEARNQLTQQSISHKKEQIKKLQFELTKAKKIAELSK